MISFTPMYSAFDGEHEYQITPSVPLASAQAATTPGLDPIDPTSLKWVLDSKFVEDKGDFADVQGSRILQTKASGTTVIQVTGTTMSGTKVRGESMLSISPATSDEWAAGDMRYNNGTAVDWSALRPMMGGAPTGDAGCGIPVQISGMIDSNSACTNCHNAMNIISVSHTPTQTAGYSDSDLIQIFTEAKKPAGGKFNSQFLSMLQPAQAECIYAGFHTWTMDEDTKKGIVYKLRSIPPAKQATLDIMRLTEAFRNMRAAGGGAAGAAP